MLAPNIADAISVAIYVRHGTNVDVKNVLRDAMSGRSNIGIHLVHESGSYYPVNYLRNVALDNAITKYVFTNDIDFLPSPNLHKLLEHYLSHGTGVNTENQALIVPAFEHVTENAVTTPKNKAALLEMWEQKAIKPFQ
ncbi:LARGE xylosyl- and glucuronyltransferase 2 [Lamellibrachia satsuma]|nr:LARGE xylosyl- and glucuronyltransferase 2 [Lamellibrachia satsuma]